MRITTWTRLRDVNGSSTDKRVQGPNKVFESADIRGIDMGIDVIVSGAMYQGLIRGSKSTDIRLKCMGRNVNVPRGLGVKIPPAFSTVTTF